MATGRYNTVTALLAVQPDVKQKKELSKQYVRDALLDIFYPPKDTEAPKWSEDTEIVEDALFGMENPRPPI